MFVAVPIMCVQGRRLSGTYSNEVLSFVKLLISHCVCGRGLGPYQNDVVPCILSSFLIILLRMRYNSSSWCVPFPDLGGALLLLT